MSTTITFSEPGSYGIRIAKEGFDVTTASSREIAFSSARTSFKQVLSGTATVSVPSAGVPTRTITTITHNLGRVTPHVVFIDEGFVTAVNPTGTFREAAVQINASNLFATAYADANNLYLVVQDAPASGYTAEFRYFVFLD